MTLNDFKSVEGDTRTGIRSLPVQLGTLGAARLACLVMALPQVAVILALFAWQRPWHGALIGALLVGQFVLMRRLLAEPRGRAAWYNGTGTTLYVLGMLVAAFALRPLVGGP
jgi:chlorophyll synthase